jgi:hypothetical protein
MDNRNASPHWAFANVQGATPINERDMTDLDSRDVCYCVQRSRSTFERNTEVSASIQLASSGRRSIEGKRKRQYRSYQ